MLTTNDGHVLQVNGLTVHYMTRQGPVYAVEDVSLAVRRGESVGLVGESGCGKTSVALSLLKLLPDNARIVRGDILLNGIDLVPLSSEEVRPLRWRCISMVFQAAMNALNPLYTVEDQILEALALHRPGMSDQEMRAKIDRLFELVGLDPVLKDQYPHQYSGGMRQRAIVAMALSCDPDIIVADEPTTALDVIVQDALLKRIREIQSELNMAMIYISHDMAVIAAVSDRVGVMYAGRLVEMASTEAIFRRPMHPYTMGLMSALPSIAGVKTPLLQLPGEPPDLLNPPPGCRFHPRCRYATGICREQVPVLKADEGQDLLLGGQHLAACWHPRGERS